ncbi:heparan-alpha-glucosaminide N-acetyltransferase domain-containing protein [uncultured Desulfosarcina sp.]|uniref:DUF418 domain-containing protein n=1 Tax=uncultured Desulfosarcina sp. TaxID=218289 RepID=UPI0029C7E4FB|nr:heparan-alpha-glucosaminide N-acetyltransferase domain-containing protein [uncultured Desulfosarcina sp.]
MEKAAQPKAGMPNRIVAYDRARALAVVGMIFVNTCKIMGVNHFKPWWMDTLARLVTGRAAVLFVMLAGAGIVLAYDRAYDHEKPLVRGRLIARASWLCIFGMLLMLVWNADILHYYTAFIAFGVLLLDWRTARLKNILTMTVAASMAVCALVTYDIEGGQILEEVAAPGLMGLVGDYFFFSKYYPVFPWFCFFLLGMLIGRLERFPERGRFHLIFITSSLCFVGIELFSAMLNAETIAGRWVDIDLPLWRAFSLSEAFPVAPLFVFSAGASGLATISLLRLLSERKPLFGSFSPLAAFGRLSLTVYISHILIGTVYCRWIDNRHALATADRALLFSTVFILAGMVFAAAWTRRFKKGPLEMVLDALSRMFLPRRNLSLRPSTEALSDG